MINILNEVASTTKKLEKLAILERYKDVDTFRKVMKYALDPHLRFYIKKIPSYTPSEEIQFTFEDAFASLDYLSAREVTGNSAIEHLKTLLRYLSVDDATVVERIIQKDLRIGVSSKTANKVFGKSFIPEFPVMLASSFNEKNLKRINFPAIAQTKMDGMRCQLVVDRGSFNAFTRNGKELDIAAHMEFDTDLSFVIDGELLVVDENNNILDRKTGNGILNKAQKGTISDEERSRIRMTAWDLIPLNEFRAGKSSQGASMRLEALQIVIDDAPFISMIESHTAVNIDSARALFKSKLEEGEEGVILKNHDSLWVAKRSPDLVKMKDIHEADLEIIGFVEGTGKNEGRLGAMVVQDKSGEVEVSVGTGFSEEQREAIWKSRNSLIGKIVAVQYNAKINSKGKDKASLFLPVFVEIREDKDAVDLL